MIEVCIGLYIAAYLVAVWWQMGHVIACHRACGFTTFPADGFILVSMLTAFGILPAVIATLIEFRPFGWTYNWKGKGK